MHEKHLHDLFFSAESEVANWENGLGPRFVKRNHANGSMEARERFWPLQKADSNLFPPWPRTNLEHWASSKGRKKKNQIGNSVLILSFALFYFTASLIRETQKKKETEWGKGTNSISQRLQTALLKFAIDSTNTTFIETNERART